MPWNEPGKDNKDPWQNKSGNQGPPDLDEILRKLTGRFGGLFGGGSSGGFGKGSAAGFYLLAVILILGWLASGLYKVDAGEQGLVLRFGDFSRTTDPGLNWHLPFPLESVEKVDVQQVRSAQHKASMLTQDENIVDIDIGVQYVVKDAEQYAFQVKDPDETLGQAMEAAVREVVGRRTMDSVLGSGRGEVSTRTGVLLQAMLDDYQTGLEVLEVNLQQAQPPEAVQSAFEDAVKAREDEVRFKNEAQSYANGIIPQARGEAARIEEEATAYRDQVIARASGDASRFSQLLVEYSKAPRVTRDRLYLDAIESVLSNSSKIMMDIEKGNNLLYLPLDKMLQGAARIPQLDSDDSSNDTSAFSNSSGQQTTGRSSDLREGR